MLAAEGKIDAGTEAKRLLASAIGAEPSRLGLAGERSLSDAEASRLAEFERLRLDGVSVGRIIGRREFHDITLAVDDGVLEPRDDTSAVVELALAFLRDVRGTERAPTFWDIGTGSGAIALSLVHALAEVIGLATDVNPRALAAVSGNAARLGIDSNRLTIERRNLFEGVGDRRFDLIVSNPPYIPSGGIAALSAEVQRDPRNALDGGPDGLDFYREIAARASAQLHPGGAIAVEIGAGQGDDVRTIMRAHGWAETEARRDLGGIERALGFRRSASGVEPTIPGKTGRRSSHRGLE